MPALLLYSNLDSFKVDGIHHCTLKKLDGGVVTLEETFQLKVGLFSESVVGPHMTHHVIDKATTHQRHALVHSTHIIMPVLYNWLYLLS